MLCKCAMDSPQFILQRFMFMHSGPWRPYTVTLKLKVVAVVRWTRGLEGAWKPPQKLDCVGHRPRYWGVEGPLENALASCASQASNLGPRPKSKDSYSGPTVGSMQRVIPFSGYFA